MFLNISKWNCCGTMTCYEFVTLHSQSDIFSKHLGKPFKSVWYYKKSFWVYQGLQELISLFIFMWCLLTKSSIYAITIVSTSEIPQCFTV
jgi:hypothetical protein